MYVKPCASDASLKNLAKNVQQRKMILVKLKYLYTIHAEFRIKNNIQDYKEVMLIAPDTSTNHSVMQ